jgi:D-alanyl-lipoteichoic acid acyltransferase DltB (MBOAT superfamily)
VLFPTIQFGIFFPIVFIGSWLLRPQPQRWKLFMIAASYVFYAFAFKGSWLPWDTGNRWKYPALLMLVTVINQVFVVGIFKARNEVTRKIWATVAVVSDLGVLAYFKYYNFGRDNFGPLLSWLPKRQVILPVAISFFIFQALSYVIRTWSPGRSCGPPSSCRSCASGPIRVSSTRPTRSASSLRACSKRSSSRPT